ncbi:MAG: J domain-containing protein [Fimbriimonadaceae bacterium]|nr:J domain-containing protein [Fimbriimonadaceae bacterium]
MSEFRRAYDIGRAFIGREFDRIKGMERDMAERELTEVYSYKPKTESEPPPIQTLSPEEEIERAKVRDRTARKLLGIAAGASFEEIKASFDRLSKRSDPANFPEGSEEQNQAVEINRKVYWAYQVLTENLDVTEKRFKSLEL